MIRVGFLTTDVREHEKDYGCDQPSFGAAPEALLRGLEEREDVEIHVISCLQQTVRSPEKIGRNIWYHGLHVPTIGWLRTGYQGCVRAVRKCLRNVQPDLVHGQGTERDCALCAVLSGFPNVVTIHGNMAELARLYGARVGSYGWCAARLENFTLRRTVGVFCNSGYTEQLVDGRARRTWQVPNPIRPEFFRPVPSSSPERRRPVIVNVGVISPRKRQVEILRLAKTLHERGFSVEFRFVGYAPKGNLYAETFLQELGIAAREGYASFVGFLPLKQLLECLDSADALVHFPSEEAFGLVVAEALARNLKFFGSRTGGIQDIVANVPGTALSDINDWEGLVGALESWLTEGCPKTNSARIMRERYAPEVVARRHVEIYREVLSSSSKSRGVGSEH
jgi:glycosyltransferase involved in cell wall biosynthesis